MSAPGRLLQLRSYHVAFTRHIQLGKDIQGGSEPPCIITLYPNRIILFDSFIAMPYAPTIFVDQLFDLLNQFMIARH